MADLNEPKKETEQIALASQFIPRPAAPMEKETTRVNPPDRPPGPPAGVKPPATSVRPPTPLPVGPRPRPLTPPTARPPSPASAAASGSSKPAFSPIGRPVETCGGVQASPKKETAGRADSLMKAAVKPGSIQPVGVPLPPVIRTGSPAVATASPRGWRASVPAQLCWALLGISVLTLLMQLWNYFS